MKSKKGVEMSIQTMVIAALALIILVVLVILFTRTIGGAGESLNACEERGYSCENQQCGSDQAYYGKLGCEEGEVCCAPSDGEDSII